MLEDRVLPSNLMNANVAGTPPPVDQPRLAAMPLLKSKVAVAGGEKGGGGDAGGRGGLGGRGGGGEGEGGGGGGGGGLGGRAGGSGGESGGDGADGGDGIDGGLGGNIVSLIQAWEEETRA